MSQQNVLRPSVEWLASGRSKLAESLSGVTPGCSVYARNAPHERRCTLCRPAHAKSDSLERPLPSHPRYRNNLLILASSLLYAEPTVLAHGLVIGAALVPEPRTDHLRSLAQRTLAWTHVRPQPRARTLENLLRADAGLSRLLTRHQLRSLSPPIAPRMRRWPDTEALPRIETIADLAAWLRVEVSYLRWFADLHGRNALPGTSPLQHYYRRVRLKPDNSLRLLESPKQHLKHIQRQILRELLVHVEVHDAVHGFCRNRSTVTYATPHAGKAMVLRIDLKDFFPSFSGPRIQAMFRALGYPEHVADLLGGLCTTAVPRAFWKAAEEGFSPGKIQQARILYARTHLPQGSPCSPAAANICARRMDQRLAALAEASGAVYTRYADDLAFSGGEEFVRSAGRFGLHAAAIASDEGFLVNHRKTRLMTSSGRQHLAGITLNGGPNIARTDVDNLKATLTNCLRYGPATQNRRGAGDFRAFLTGKVAYVAMVNPARGAKLRALLDQIAWE